MKISLDDSDSNLYNEEIVVHLDISLSDLKISSAEVISSLGYSNDEPSAGSRRPDTHITESIDYVILQLEKLCTFSAGYRIVDTKSMTENKDGLYLENKFFNLDKIVTSKLRKSEKAAIFVCTIGPQMENWSGELMASGEALLSYVVSTTASVVVDQAVDFLHDNVSRRMREQGLKITNRYSPGYCNWPVSEQHLLFSLLPEKFCGVTLTESALMLPIKSISGIIGIGKSVKMKEYLCDTCGMKDCTYRSKRRIIKRIN